MHKKSRYFENIKFLIFLVLLCFCLIIISVFEYQQIKLYRQEQSEREYLRLNIYASKLDDEIERASDYINLLSLESSVVEFAKSNAIGQYEKIKLYKYIQDTYPYYGISNGNIIMYKPECDYFISKDGIEHLVQMENEYGNIPYNDLEIEKFEENKLIQIPDEYSDEIKDNYILFFIKKNVVIDKDICFLLVLNKNAMAENMEKELLNGFYINDKSGRLFEYNSEQENDKKEIIWTNSIVVPDWQYGLKVGGFDVPFYFAVQFVVTLLGLILISMWISKYIAMKIYKPFKSFFEKYFAGRNIYDEFGMIEETFESLVKNNTELGTRLESYEVTLKGNFLRDVFIGKIDESEIKNKKNTFSLKIGEAPFGLACVAVWSNSSDASIFYDEVYEEFLEELADVLSAECFEFNFGKMIFLYPWNKNKTAEMIILKKITFAEQKFNAKIRAVMLDKKLDRLEDLCGLYTEIIEISDLYLSSQEQVVWHCKNNKEENDRYYYPMEIETRFISFVREGNREEMHKLLWHIFDVNMTEKRISSEELVEFKFALMLTARRVVERFNLSEQMFANEENIRDMIVFSHSYERLKEVLVDFYDNVLDFIKNENAERQNLLFNEIHDYVTENFDKTEEISVINIATRFNISVGYISKLYKKVTGQTFIEYVLGLRMEEAKKLLLKKPLLKINEVAEKVGYSNASSFTRIFKKIMGVSPGEYRAISFDTDDTTI